MQHEKLNAVDACGAVVERNVGVSEQLSATGQYTVTCVGADGQIKWEDTFKNLVVTEGKNDLLDKYFTGSSYTATWYLGLVDGASAPTYAAGDTMSSHAGWTENEDYAAATRPAPTWNGASSGSKATNATSFSIDATATIAGAFMTTDNTKGGTSGILYSAGNFSGGNRSVASGDTLNVTYTASV